MRKIVLFFLSAILLSGCNKATLSAGGAMKGVLIEPKEYADVVELAESVAPAVVGVSSVSSGEQSVGSGVCVVKGGYVLTNSHVIINDDNITLYLSNGETASAKLIWSDDSQDIAILKAGCVLPYLSLSGDDNISVGQDIVAVGTPLSLLLKHSFTKGIVSALNRTLKVQGTNGESYMQNLVQHDASLNPGNSGGPLLNLKGEVVGINTLKISGGEGIGFAIPVKSFSSLLDNIVATKTSYETPYLGVYGYDAEIAEFNKICDRKRGFFIEDISDKSPLKKLGVNSGAVIVDICGKAVNNALDLRNELYKHKKGDKIRVKCYDGERVVEGAVTLSKK